MLQNTSFMFINTKNCSKIWLCLRNLLVLTESEKEYVWEFNDKKYIPELLFEDKEMVNRIKFHPMALWKTRSR